MEEVEAPSCQNKDHYPIAKGKRSKRHRPLSPIPFTFTSSTIGGDYDTTTDNNGNPRPNPSFSIASSEDSTTTEEQDTAISLILLARGHYSRVLPNPKIDYNLQFSKVNKRYEETSVAATNKPNDTKLVGGACIYACKTCNRAFASFQALGGHRASHKKPKNDKKLVIFDEEDFPSPSKKIMPPNSLSLQLSNISTASTTMKPFPSPRMHECSYCGMEFTSGQALGGHMRRHRAGMISQSLNQPAAYIMDPEEPKQPKNGLSLDLNLPAPEDENKKLDLEKRQQQQQQNEVAKNRLLLSTNPTLANCPY
ncbi:hypothetical protein BUALT_Bualt01G0097300 [Buddleja alternifolia]|uniref:C2H2-type domain-containing protein n=1 Tax=Buddleja alternifolia TaxID=168488 RepID=A0AAV6YCE7_9LAMI|nr:hypothetical protein BUALT_Bualt01G0097300 [Buddleja alternifolia]